MENGNTRRDGRCNLAASGKEGSPKSVLVVMVLLFGVCVVGTVVAQLLALAEHESDPMTSSKELADSSRAHSKNATSYNGQVQNELLSIRYLEV